jgi:NTP pyrophosphatase (non-canonical NTP hydrolase)
MTYENTLLESNLQFEKASCSKDTDMRPAQALAAILEEVQKFARAIRAYRPRAAEVAGE